MGKKEAGQLYTASKDWITDIPLRLGGFIMAVILFIGRLLGIAIWLNQYLPPLYIWLAFGLAMIGIIWLSFLPYYKRVIKRESTLSKNIAYIGMFIQEGTEHLERFDSQPAEAITDHEMRMLLDWIRDIGEYLQTNLRDEFPLWFRSTGTVSKRSSFDDLLMACKNGLDRLEHIFTDLKCQDQK